jgi:hypothetical protein
MEDMDEELDLAEVDKDKMDEEKEVEEGYGKKEMEEAYDDSMEEELDLDEILAELELEEGKEVEEAEEIDEAKEVEEAKDELDEAEEVYEAEDEINLEDMSEEELKDMIEDVIEDMVASGELEAGGDPVELVDDEEEEEEGEEIEMDVETEEEPLNESVLGTALAGVLGVGGLATLMTFLEDYAEKNPNAPVAKVVDKLQKVAAGTGAATGITGGKTAELGEGLLDFLKKKKAEAPKEKSGPKVVGVDFDGNYIYDDDPRLEEAKEVINQLRSDLNEVNLLNSKLLYTNKIFRGKNLTENQKIKVLKAFDKAETVKEAKSIFETLNENLVAKSAKSNIRESLGMASKPAGVAPKRQLNENVVQEDAMIARFKKLAGIN